MSARSVLMLAESTAGTGREAQEGVTHRRVTGSRGDAEGVLKEVQHVTDGEGAPGCKTDRKSVV